MNDLMLTILLLVAGIGVGLVTGIARVPRVRAIPLAAACTLTVSLALVLVLTRPTELWLGLSLAAAIVLSGPVSAAWMWKREVGVQAGYGWILTQEFFRPGLLRRLHGETSERRASASASRR